MAVKFGTIIRNIREQNGWSLEQMAEKLETTKQALSYYERGKRTPKITVAAKFAEKLDVPLKFLVGSDNDIQDFEWTPTKESELSKADQDRLKAIHDNPTLQLLFDKQKELSESDLNAVLAVVSAISKGQ